MLYMKIYKIRQVAQSSHTMPIETASKQLIGSGMNKTLAYIKTKTEDIFAYKQMSKDEFLQYELKHCKKAKMAVGKLLVPELVKYMNITIDDLKKFKFAIDEIPEKHSYEKIIYDAYIKNNDFILTQEQRDKAYQEYKKYR